MNIPRFLEEALENRECARVAWTQTRHGINRRLARFGTQSVSEEDIDQEKNLMKVFRTMMIEQNQALSRYYRSATRAAGL
jgi:hypothetical protein